MSTAQLIVTLAFVGLLGAFHLLARAARASAGTAAVTAARPAFRRGPTTALLLLAALAALGFVVAAVVLAAADEDDDAVAPTQPPTTTMTTMPPMPPPPPEPPRAALQAPGGTALVARVVTNAKAVVTSTRNRVGDRVRVMRRETGVYTVSVPGLSPARGRDAVIRAQPADGAGGVKVSARRVGAGTEFMVFSRDAKTGEFTDAGFEFAVFLPKQDLEATAADDDPERPELPGTR